MSYWSLLELLICDRMQIWTRSGGICMVLMAKRVGSAQRWQRHLSPLHLHLSGNEYINVISHPIENRYAFRYILHTFEHVVSHRFTKSLHVAKFV